MRPTFHHILILYKALNSEAASLAAVVASWLEEKGIKIWIAEAGQLPESIATDTDCAVVLGGDGTILGLARKLAGRQIPIFGINFGRVGFLTAAGSSNWRQLLKEAITGNLPVHSCMALNWHLVRDGLTVRDGVAINDVVVSRGALARLVCLRIKINYADMGVLRSDGLIICTPLGSSGYSISAGGPLLYAGMNAIGITALCPFSRNISPLVFPVETSVELRIVKPSADCYITIDGQEGQKLADNDIISITGWPGAIQFLGSDNQFFEHLRTRGFKLEQ